jgi:hypothetical protein
VPPRCHGWERPSVPSALSAAIRRSGCSAGGSGRRAKPPARVSAGAPLAPSAAWCPCWLNRPPAVEPRHSRGERANLPGRTSKVATTGCAKPGRPGGAWYGGRFPGGIPPRDARPLCRRPVPADTGRPRPDSGHLASGSGPARAMQPACQRRAWLTGWRLRRMMDAPMP